MELAIAKAVAPFLKNTKPRDLMIWPIDQEPEATDVKDVFAVLKSVSAPKRTADGKP